MFARVELDYQQQATSQNENRGPEFILKHE